MLVFGQPIAVPLVLVRPPRIASKSSMLASNSISDNLEILACTTASRLVPIWTWQLHTYDAAREMRDHVLVITGLTWQHTPFQLVLLLTLISPCISELCTHPPTCCANPAEHESIKQAGFVAV